MKISRLPLALTSAAMLLGACTKDSTAPVTHGSVQLSAAQATAVKDRIVQLANVNPDLAWLADTIRLVVGTGTEVAEVPLTTDLGTGQFYAVSLQRTITTASSASSTFDVILFDNPSDPQNFMIVSGWVNPGGNTLPPPTLEGAVGSATATSTINAHLFHVDGATVSAWRITGGTAAFTTGEAAAGPCASVTNSAGVTCNPANLTVTFGLTESTPESQSATGTRTASLGLVSVSGIMIRMDFE